MNNKMADIAHMFGLELEEEFDLEYTDPVMGHVDENPHRLTRIGLKNVQGDCCGQRLIALLCGKLIIAKRPFRPKEGEWYWFITSNNGEAMQSMNGKFSIDYHRISSGNCYRTKEEAEEHAQEWIDKMRAFFEGEGGSNGQNKD